MHHQMSLTQFCLLLLWLQDQHKLAGLFKAPEEPCNGASLANGSSTVVNGSAANKGVKVEANGSAAVQQNGGEATGGGGFSFGFKL